MPLTLQQLKEKRDNHVKKIEEEKRKAATIYSYQRTHKINPEQFMNFLSYESSEVIESTIRIYPSFKQLVDCIYKAAKEEKKRRECEEKIAMMKEKRLKKRKREEDEKSQRMKMITDGSGEGTLRNTQMETN